LKSEKLGVKLGIKDCAMSTGQLQCSQASLSFEDVKLIWLREY